MEDIYEKDGLEAVEELNYKIERLKKTAGKTKTILRVYTYTGILTFAIGGLFFTFSYYEFKITEQQTTTLLVSGVGIVVAIFAALLRQLLNEREKQLKTKLHEANQITNFMTNWVILEKTLNRLLEFTDKYENKFAISKNLELLHKEKKISHRDYVTIEKALSIRNSIAHGGTNLPMDEINKYSEKLEIVTDKLIDQM